MLCSLSTTKTILTISKCKYFLIIFQWYMCGDNCVKDKLSMRGRATRWREKNEVAKTCMAEDWKRTYPVADFPELMWPFKIKDCAFEKCSGSKYTGNIYRPCTDPVWVGGPMEKSEEPGI